MVEIIPAILEPDFIAVADKIRQIEGRAEWVHLDITDGHFVPSVSWQTPQDLGSIDGRTRLEAHLMIEHPEEVIENWAQVVDRIIVHYESTENLLEIIDAIDQSPLPVEIGLALLLPTPLGVVERHAVKLDVIQLMGITRVGYQGQSFDPLVLERIKFLHEKYPDVKISLDGGVNLENVSQLVVAGADNIIVGSGIWKGDAVGNLKKFQDAIGRES